MTPEMQPVDLKPYKTSPRSSRVTTALAVIGFLTVLGGVTVLLKSVGITKWSILDLFTDSDEAPIRGRGGSIDLFVVSASQEWRESGSSGNFNIHNTQRYRDDFEVTVAVRTGATCGAQTATGSDIVVTYNDEKRIRLQSLSRRTWVKPENGATLTWNAAEPQKLSYPPAGFIRSIAVGNGANPTTMCSFTAANQLDHMIILNVP
jgi:hypothetical protein